MTHDGARRAEELFQAACDLPAAERDAFVRGACAEDRALYAEVTELLAHLDESSDQLLRGAAPPIRLADAGLAITDPDTIGPYRILSRIGVGGFGVVYDAEQSEPIRRRVALKVLKAGMDTDAFLARFEAERQALALMDHQNIARVLDAGATELGRPYSVMELVKGEPVTLYCDRHRLGIDERLQLFLPICRAVQHAHQKGIIHRDLKPSNILVAIVDGEPVPKIIDFGIAKAIAAPLTDRAAHTIAGQMIGTLAYMSPEQAERTGLDVDTTTDIYALGVILYELLAGELPFDPAHFSEEPLHKFAEILRASEPLAPSARAAPAGERAAERAHARSCDPWQLAARLRGDLDWIVLRAIDKDRTRRYQTALELAQDIRHHLADEPISAGPPSTPYRLRKFVRRHRVAISLAAAAVFALFAGGALLSYGLVQAKRERQEARRSQQESQAVSQFLSEMLSAVAPSARGRDVTVRELLDGAVPTLGRQFEDQPLIEAELRTVIGTAYCELGEFEAADENLRRGVELWTQHAAPSHPGTLAAQIELAVLRRETGDFERAESTFVAVRRARESLFGPHARPTLEAVSNLATLYIRLERHAELLALTEPVIAPATREFGEADRLTRTLARALGLAYQSLGRFDDAERVHKENLRIDLQSLGPKHVETIASQYNLGSLYRETGRLEEAVPYYEGSIRDGADVYGEEHPEYLRLLNNLALLYSDLGRFEEAEPLARRVVEARDRILGEENPSTLASRINLALLYSRMGRWEECEQVAKRTIDSASRTLGAGHFTTLSAQGVLCRAYLGSGRVAQAAEIVPRVVEGFRALYPDGHWRLGRAFVTQGAIHAALGRYAEAESLLLDGEAQLSAAFEPTHDLVREAVDALIDLYDRWRKPDARAKWEARRDAARKVAPATTDVPR